MPIFSQTLARLVPGRGRTSALGGRLREAESPSAMQKGSRVGPLIAYENLGEPVWSPRDYGAFAREGFMQNAIVYRSVRMVAEAAASIPFLLYQGDEEIEAHPLIDLIRQPSLDHTGIDFLESWYGFLLVAGNAYVEAVALDGMIRELHVLRPDRMKVIPGLDGWPAGYEYTAGGRSVRFIDEPVAGVRPILHVRMFHPANDHYGMSPIEAAAVAIDIHNTAAGWNKALLDNSARPSGALVYNAANGQMTDEQFARLKSELETTYQGAKHAGRPLLLEGGLDWKPLSLSPKDMDFIEAKNSAAREIALALGVPPQLLGIPGDNTYSNYAEAQRAFWRQTVLPLVNRTLRALSGWLSPTFGGSLSLRADLDQVEAFTPEREALWARLQSVTFITDDEKRAAAGYGPALSSIGPSAPRRRPLHVDVQKYSPDQPRVSAGNSDGGQWTSGDGGSGTDSLGGEDGNDRLAQAGPEKSSAVDLQVEDVQLGGHTVARHTARSNDELLEIVRRDRVFGLFVTIARRAQGSFLSVEDANNYVNRVLEENTNDVAAVGRGDKLEADFIKRLGYVTGKEAYRPDVDAEPYMRPTYEVYVHIQHDKRHRRGFRVFRAYPMNSRGRNE